MLQHHIQLYNPIHVDVLLTRTIVPVSMSNSLTVPSEEADAQLKPPGSQLAKRMLLTSARWMLL
jgi:hypothetical protein